MFRKFLTVSALSLMILPLEASSHELILTFEPLEGQSKDKLIADQRACEEKVVEDGIEEPHPIVAGDPLERHAPKRTGRSGIGVGTSIGGVGVGANVGGTQRPRSETDWALKDAEHLNRHNAYEIAMTACMQEKGYEE